jgi:predicted glutamine amidotransferase
MCGIVGVAASFVIHKEKDIFKELFYVSALRGWHSSGVMSLRVPYKMKKEEERIEYSYYKEAIHPADALGKKEFNDHVYQNDIKVIVGHTRYATQGAVNNQNAHPFMSKCGRILGVHNGTIPGEFPFRKDFDTDSEAFINLMAERGIEEAIKCLQEGGAYCLVWFDTEDNTFNLLRNNERTLYGAWTKSAASLLFASEAENIQLVSARRGEPLEKEPWLLKANTLVTFQMEDRPNWRQYTVKDIEPPQKKKSSSVIPYYYGKKEVGEEHWWDHIYPTRRSLPPPEEKAPQTENKTIQQEKVGESKAIWGDSYTDPSGKVWEWDAEEETYFYNPDAKKEKKEWNKKGFLGYPISRDDYEDALSCGCVLCWRVPDDDKDIAWVGIDEIACRDCKGTPAAIEYRRKNEEDVTGLVTH